MKTDELRKVFLDYFRERKHTVVPSASLVPEGDPTLLFNIAGMVQFKQFYASSGNLPFTRAATVQKCLRATDLDEVGRTIKHHTFFEMLGNFSFGDYFKEEAIEWAWDFIRRVVHLPEDRLHVTVYQDDDESERLWVDKMGVNPDRVYRLGDCDNFWGPAGSTGACGPCSEIHYDRGEGEGCGKPDCSPACDCDRFVEVWNLVFPQFYQEADGSRRVLERRGVDTGMGLERLAMVCQGVGSTFDTDGLKPLVDFVKEASSREMDPAREISARVIADHARALCFAISEGALPSNEGRGYVVRRILRRAVVKAMDLGIEDPFVFKAVGRVIDGMRGAYPDLADHGEKIALIVKSDEDRFQRTLARGMSMLEETFDSLDKESRKTIPGEAVFKLYDTYGFPVDITRELARARGFEIDAEGFEHQMEEQRRRAREASKIGVEAGAADQDRVPDNFVGYDNLEIPTVVTALSTDCGGVTRIHEGDEAWVEMERTPFYPEGGGQVGDSGVLEGTEGRARVLEVGWGAGAGISHRVRVEKGRLSTGEGVIARVDAALRKATQRNHTATHLLHAALRSVLGGHVRQAGSLVAPDHLRFDFTHFEPMDEDDLAKVEDIVNSRILDNRPVRPTIEAFEKAKAKGAIALFGEKYGQEVRVVTIEDASCELCGGTHVGSTGEIGGFRVVSESGIAAGIRRIEAITGLAFVRHVRELSGEIAEVSSLLKVPAKDLGSGARKVMDRTRDLERELSQLRQRLAGSRADDIISGVKEVAGVKVAAARMETGGMDVLKQTADRLRERLPGGVICLGSADGEKVFIVVSVDPAVVSEHGLKASAIAKRLGEVVGGRGGGKDTFAQAGGRDPSALDRAIESSMEVISELVR
jgi:alanyl-tRNA synthetase